MPSHSRAPALAHCAGTYFGPNGWDGIDALDAMPLSADDPPLWTGLDGLDVEQGFEDWGEIFGDEVAAAALIGRLITIATSVGDV